MEGIVIFNMDPELLEVLSNEDQRSKLYFNAQMIQKIESQVRVWHKLIERVPDILNLNYYF